MSTDRDGLSASDPQCYAEAKVANNIAATAAAADASGCTPAAGAAAPLDANRLPTFPPPPPFAESPPAAPRALLWALGVGLAVAAAGADDEDGSRLDCGGAALLLPLRLTVGVALMLLLVVAFAAGRVNTALATAAAERPLGGVS